jgi:membrane protein DedA with SNARE-associated domain
VPERQPRRLPLPLLLAPILAAMAVSFVADIIGPGLIGERPLLQVFLNPRNRYLILASPQVDALAFFLVGFFRLVLTDPLAYVLGRQYGDAAVRWLAEHSDENGAVADRVLHWFGKGAPFIVFLAPNLYVCALSGATGMRPRLFVPLNIGGTIARLVVFRLVGEAFRDELLSVLDFVQRYQWPLIAVSFVVVTLQARRSGAARRLSLPATEEELRAEAEAATEEDGRPRP